MISDKLFLAWNCPNCSKIKSIISRSTFDDSMNGNDGQFLNVIHTFSNAGSRDILNTFELHDKCAPVLLTHNKKIIDDVEEIISYLKDNDLTDQK